MGPSSLLRSIPRRAMPPTQSLPRVELVVDLRLDVNPTCDCTCNDVGAIVGRKVVLAEFIECRVIQPRVPESAEVPMMNVGVDHWRHDPILVTSSAHGQ
jgi:hypothetical protein